MSSAHTGAAGAFFSFFQHRDALPGAFHRSPDPAASLPAPRAPRPALPWSCAAFGPAISRSIAFCICALPFELHDLHLIHARSRRSGKPAHQLVHAPSVARGRKLHFILLPHIQNAEAHRRQQPCKQIVAHRKKLAPRSDRLSTASAIPGRGRAPCRSSFFRPLPASSRCCSPAASRRPACGCAPSVRRSAGGDRPGGAARPPDPPCAGAAA